MRTATDGEVETAFYLDEFCIGCRKWRDNPEAKTQCKISALASIGENYKGYWKTDDNGKTFCTKYQIRKPIVKETEPTELMKRWL